jgi:hypothetical protein
MSIFEQIQLNKKVPKHESYDDNVIKNEFTEEATEVSSDYWDTPPLNQKEALTRFVCESKEDQKFRREITTPKNYCGSILNKYLSTCFKEKPVRKENDFYNNVDTLGSDISSFMEMASKASLIDGVSYILPDSTSTDPNLSEAQKKVLGVKPFLRFISCRRVINYSDYLGHLMEALIEFEDEAGECYFIYYDTVNYARIDVDKKNVVVAIGSLEPHNYSTIPVTRVMPFDTEESFLASGAALQLSVNNLTSLERVELYKSTFSRFFLSGIQLASDPDGNPLPVSWGNDRIMTAPNADAKITPLGADVGQAQSIRTSIENEVNNLYKTYHLSATSVGEVTQVPSGISLIISRADFNSICTSIVKSVQQAEAKLVMLLNETEGLNLEPAVYSFNFIEPDKSEDIMNLRDILSLDLDESAKNIAKQQFVEKYLKPKE